MDSKSETREYECRNESIVSEDVARDETVKKGEAIIPRRMESNRRQEKCIREMESKKDATNEKKSQVIDMLDRSLTRRIHEKKKMRSEG